MTLLLKPFLFGLAMSFFSCRPTTSDRPDTETASLFAPVIDGEWWQVASNPDLGELTGPDQQPVDFGIWQAADGSWQVWSCIRKTKESGKTRLFHRWEGQNLTDSHWEPKGIAMRSDPSFGEEAGGLQAPFVMNYQKTFWMFYGDWNRICLAKSEDGKNFNRVLRDGSPALFGDPKETNTRDAMVLPVEARWYCYYTAHPSGDGAVFVRTSADLFNWSSSTKAAYGGQAGKGELWYAECPFVVKLEDNYYHFRTQSYGRGVVDSLENKQQTSVYRSPDPMDFGVDNDQYFIGKLPVAAPEIFQYKGQWFIAALMPDLQGIRISKLKWEQVN